MTITDPTTAAPPATAVGLLGHVQASHLLTALGTVSIAVGGKRAYRATRDVRLDASDRMLSVSAFDFDTHATTFVPSDTTDAAILSVHVPHEDLLTFTKALDENDVMRLEAVRGDRGGQLIVSTGSGHRTALPITDPQDTVEPWTLSDFQSLVSVTGKTLARVAASVLPFTSPDYTLPVLTAVALHLHDGKVTFAATDRYRLGVVTVDDKPGSALTKAPVLIPRATLKHLSSTLKAAPEVRLLSATATGVGTVVTVVSGRDTITFRPIEGAFPSVHQLLPGRAETAPSFSVPSADALKKAASAILGKRKAPLCLTFDPTAQTVVASEADTSNQATVPLPGVRFTLGDDMPLVLGLNPTYLAQIVTAFGKGATVTAQLDADGPARRPILITAPQRPDLTALLMPVTLGGR